MYCFLACQEANTGMLLTCECGLSAEAEGNGK